jgi:hypothetical protein
MELSPTVHYGSKAFLLTKLMLHFLECPINLISVLSLFGLGSLTIVVHGSSYEAVLCPRDCSAQIKLSSSSGKIAGSFGSKNVLFGCASPKSLGKV